MCGFECGGSIYTIMEVIILYRKCKIDNYRGIKYIIQANKSL